MKSSRETALLILHDINENGAYSNIALKNGLAASGLGGMDRAFVSNMVYGVLSRRITLDYIIRCYSKIRLKKISSFILDILRMGIYQIYYMNTPNSAAVNESVKLAKRYGHKASSGFVNGVLHSVINGRETLSYPDDKLRNMSVKYSFPEWMCEKFIAEFGDNRAASIMQALNSVPEMVIRTNTLKTTRYDLIKMLSDKGITAEAVQAAPEAVKVSGLDVSSDSLYRNGFYTVQDTAAQLAVTVLNPKSGDTVIDMCAAPGGKATYAAQLMNNCGRVLALDIYPHKTEIIKANAQRLGIDIIDAQECDGTVHHKELCGCADKIIADVPCSGWGIIRRKPDIKYTAREDSDICAIQYAILENAAQYLKSGGTMVYSTCTINPDENERMIEHFLKNHQEFRLSDNIGIADTGYITLYPDTHGTDGFFICKLEKNGEPI